MPMNSSFWHCMWSDRKSRLSLTPACEFFFFPQGWTYLVPVWTGGPVLDPYWLICDPLLDRGSIVVFCGLKRYPEPMAHGPEACEPSHPLWPMAQRPASRHTRAEAVDTGYPCSLTREIWNLICNQ